MAEQDKRKTLRAALKNRLSELTPWSVLARLDAHPGQIVVPGLADLLDLLLELPTIDAYDFAPKSNADSADDALPWDDSREDWWESAVQDTMGLRSVVEKGQIVIKDDFGDELLRVQLPEWLLTLEKIIYVLRRHDDGPVTGQRLRDALVRQWCRE